MCARIVSHGLGVAHDLFSIYNNKLDRLAKLSMRILEELRPTLAYDDNIMVNVEKVIATCW